MLTPPDISKVHNGIVSLGHEEKQLFSPFSPVCWSRGEACGWACPCCGCGSSSHRIRQAHHEWGPFSMLNFKNLQGFAFPAQCLSPLHLALLTIPLACSPFYSWFRSVFLEPRPSSCTDISSHLTVHLKH